MSYQDYHKHLVRAMTSLCALLLQAKSNPQATTPFVIVNEVKQSITTNSNFKNRKEKEFAILVPIRHCEGRRPAAIHKPQTPYQKIEK